MRNRLLKPALALLALTLIPLLLTACGDDDGGVEVTGNSVTVSGEEAPEAGVVTAKPAEAVQVDVVLKEWAVQMGSTTVRPGSVYFLVDNQGPEDPHEFVIIKSDASPLSLPYTDNRVPEDKVDIIDEIEPYLPKTKASIAVNLTAGNYLLICNISEIENGQVESHYKLGMVAQFKVQ